MLDEDVDDDDEECIGDAPALFASSLARIKSDSSCFLLASSFSRSIDMACSYSRRRAPSPNFCSPCGAITFSSEGRDKICSSKSFGVHSRHFPLSVREFHRRRSHGQYE